MKSPDHYASRSLIACLLTGIATGIHHAYEIGSHAWLIILLFVMVPAVLMVWFRRTQSKPALVMYGLINLWLVIGFGLADGFWNHVLSPLGTGLHTLLSLHGAGPMMPLSQGETGFIYEITGALAFVAAAFAANYGYKFIRAHWQADIKITNAFKP